VAALGQTVRKLGAAVLVTVTFITAAVTPLAGTGPAPVTLRGARRALPSLDSSPQG
jgi:hypothetical protein